MGAVTGLVCTLLCPADQQQAPTLIAGRPPLNPCLRHQHPTSSSRHPSSCFAESFNSPFKNLPSPAATGFCTCAILSKSLENATVKWLFLWVGCSTEEKEYGLWPISIEACPDLQPKTRLEAGLSNPPPSCHQLS